jgi:hypothetical protein
LERDDGGAFIEIRQSVACSAIVIGLASQGLLARQAEAVPGLQRITATSALNSSTSKTVAARCPTGKRVLGGGGTITGGRGQVVLEQLEPAQTATDDRFVVSAREDGSGYSRNWRLTAYALCASPLPGYGILPSTSGSPSSNSPQSTISFCIGQPEVGFGGRINGGAGQVHLTNLVRDSNGTVDFTSIAALEDANGFAGAWTVTAYAVCASVPANLTPASATTPPSSANKSATASCPAGTLVHGAGGQLTVPAGAVSADRRLVIDNVAIDPQLRSVTVRAVEDEAGTAAAWSVTALALCGP